MDVNALIVSPTGRPLYCFGKNSHARFTAGQYEVSIEWHLDGRETEPMMAIWRKAGGMHAGVFAVCLSSIGKYADPSGTPTREAFLECWRALPTLGVNQLVIEVYKLLEVIIRHTPDLINCPPVPRGVRLDEAGEPLIEVTTMINGKRTAEVVL